jgi:uncharacterized protein (DUF433 family)
MVKATLDELYRGSALIERPLYAVSDASRYLRIPEGTLRKWVAGRKYALKDGTSARSEAVILVTQEGWLSFYNLAEAHVLNALRKQFHLSLPQIRRAVGYLRQAYGTRYPLVQHELLTDRKHLFIEAVHEAGADVVLVNASRHGQLAMRDLLDVHLRRLEWDARGLVARLYPFTRVVPSTSENVHQLEQPRWIVIDPRRRFGAPILTTSGVSTAVVAARWKAGESVSELADDYGEEPVRIEEAIRCEVILQAA